MSAKIEKDKTKQLQDKCQSVLNNLLRDEDNKYCVDCDSKGPRWASWNIGVFLCIRCAGIHRNLGVHISKVKSVNLDTWTPEQVVSLQQMGNSRARAVYEANLPDNFRRPQSDSSLESFIRAKYEHKKYIAREWVPPSLPKVNWEKEIDEEIEKQKKKKKTVIEKKSLGNIEVPQLPKPTNPSPKPARTVISEVATDNKEKKDDDLLGLHNGEDSFSNFISAPSTAEQTTKAESSVKNEEDSFFNQIVPTEKEKVKLDKDSILALYGSAPANNCNQFQNVPTAFQPQNYPCPQMNFQSFQAFPHQQNVITQSNMPPMNAQWSPHVGQWNPQFVSNSHLPGQNQFSNQTQLVNVPQQIPANQFLQLQANTQGVNFSQTPNPFLGNHNLPQQFSNLSLNNQGASTTYPGY